MFCQERELSHGITSVSYVEPDTAPSELFLRIQKELTLLKLCVQVPAFPQNICADGLVKEQLSAS